MIEVMSTGSVIAASRCPNMPYLACFLPWVVQLLEDGLMQL